jgi:hypothetical protein
MILEEMEMIGRNRKCFREGVAKIENGAWRIKGKIVNGFGRGVLCHVFLAIIESKVEI